MTAPELLQEARRMPDAAIDFARGVSTVRTPEHLVPLRERVRSEHLRLLRSVHAALYERFRITGDYINVFYAAAELAVMEQIGRNELPADDRRTLRRLWEDLLAAA